MVKKNGLGKGLGALMSEAEEEVSESIVATSPVNNDTLVNVDLLEPNPQQPRTEFNETALMELAESIKEHGIIQPILVEKSENGGYFIIAGERRTRAARLAGLKNVPVRIQKYSEQKKLEVALIENIQREDLNAVEEALAYKKLMQIGNLNQDEVAKKVGKSRSAVANCLRLLKLPSDMQTSLANSQLTAGHARALLSVNNSADQRTLFGKIVGSSLSVREAESEASVFNAAEFPKATSSNKKAVPPRDPDLAHIEQLFIEKLGTKVVIKGDFEKGYLTIDYFSKDDLDRLYAIIIGE